MSHQNYTPLALTELTERVGTQAIACGQHDMALSALLSAYFTVAMAHPCCLQECANQTLMLSMRLAQEARNHNTHPSTAIH